MTDYTDSEIRPRPRRRRRVFRALTGAFILIIAVAVLLVVYESRTARLQSWYFSGQSARLTFELLPGPSEATRYPAVGPYDIRYGYSRIGDVVPALRSAGFTVDAQVRVSDWFARVMDRGLSPVYHEKDRAGITILDRRGETIFRARYPERAYASFDTIPPVVWQSLLFIEDRHLLDSVPPTRNAAVDPPRLASAILDLGRSRLGRSGSVPGASTLATQLEKFRHGPGGRTGSPRDKLRQMWSASMRSYIDGPETLGARREIARAYINSMPLSGTRGQGEVTGLADGLWAWFGADFDDVNALLADAADPGNELDPARHGLAYRQVLELLLSVQRPTYYLIDPAGRKTLAERSSVYLGLLANQGIISDDLRDAARAANPVLLDRAPARAAPSYVDLKAANAVRLNLLRLVKLPALYSLDRLDVTVGSTIDARAQRETTALLRRLQDSDYARAQGLMAYRMLEHGDPARVGYAVVLYEKTPLGNVVRIQADNVDAPFNVIDGAKLELGSSAKLRTLVTYLEIVERLYHEITDTTAVTTSAVPFAPTDPLTLWAQAYLDVYPRATLSDILAASMERRYSASPAERFYTGGGLHAFKNFESDHDAPARSVRDAFRDSVNLSFIRIMRDIVSFHVQRLPGHAATILTAPEDPRRQEYLARFADKEGRQYLDRFQRKHTWTSREGAIASLLQGHNLSPGRLAWAFRSIAPEATVDEFGDVLGKYAGNVTVSPAYVRELFDRADPANVTLVDRGYLSGIHPLELWLVEYRLRNPDATREQVMEASRTTRQDVYRWLFSTRRTAVQNQRIRSVMEAEAFVEIHRAWKRLGYPFQSLVPSLATAIGSSADSPAQLAELVGILLNDGARRPPLRMERITLAADTPYETRLSFTPQSGEQVLSRDIAAVVRDAMVNVVQNGTARRAFGAVVSADGTPLTIGAKTGTGNNRHRVFGRGGKVIEDRALNRTSTLVFFIDERFYGTITAFVFGTEADDYGFTSSLPAQVLKMLGPTLGALITEGDGAERADIDQ